MNKGSARYQKTLKRRLSDIENTQYDHPGDETMTLRTARVIEAEVTEQAIRILAKTDEWRGLLICDVDTALTQIHHLMLAIASEHDHKGSTT